LNYLILPVVADVLLAFKGVATGNNKGTIFIKMTSLLSSRFSETCKIILRVIYMISARQGIYRMLTSFLTKLC